MRKNEVTSARAGGMTIPSGTENKMATTITLEPTFTNTGEPIYGTGEGVYFHGQWFKMDCQCGTHTDGWVEKLFGEPGVECDGCDRIYILDIEVPA